MPRQGRLDGDLRGLVVADLTDEHHVGVRPQDRAQRPGERQPGLRVDLHLVDPGEPVLDRILDGDHVDLRAGDGVQRGVQGGGLARAGRTGHQDHPVRLGERLPVLLVVVIEERQVPQVEARGRVVEDTHDDLLAPDGRKRRHPEIDLASLVRHRHATVLRLAPFGDVDVAHDLHAGDHAALDLLGRPLHLVEHPVDAVPHAEVVLGRLDMDVRRPVGDRLGHQEVHVPDDRRVIVDEVAHARQVVLDIRLLVLERRREVLHLAVGPAEAVDRADEVVVRRDDGLHLSARHRADVVDGDDVARVGRREDQDPVLDADRQDDVAPAQRGGDHGHGLAVDRIVVQVDEVHPDLPRQRRHELRLGEDTVLDERAAQ